MKPMMNEPPMNSTAPTAEVPVLGRRYTASRGQAISIATTRSEDDGDDVDRQSPATQRKYGPWFGGGHVPRAGARSIGTVTPR